MNDVGGNGVADPDVTADLERVAVGPLGPGVEQRIDETLRPVGRQDEMVRQKALAVAAPEHEIVMPKSLRQKPAGSRAARAENRKPKNPPKKPRRPRRASRRRSRISRHDRRGHNGSA